MFDVSARLLDGTSHRFQLHADSTIAEFRTEIERTQELPPFHEIKLFHGSQELVDGTALRIELTAVKTQSPAKAFKVLESESVMVLTQPDRRAALDTRELEDSYRSALDAAVALSKMGPLNADQCERFWELPLMTRREPVGPVTAEGKVLSQLQLTLGFVFGGVCGSPHVYMPRLLQILRNPWAVGFVWAPGAVAELSVRFADEYGQYSQELLEWAERHCPTEWGGGWPSVDYCNAHSAFCILGQFGNVSHKKLLESHVLEIERCIQGFGTEEGAEEQEELQVGDLHWQSDLHTIFNDGTNLVYVWKGLRKQALWALASIQHREQNCTVEEVLADHSSGTCEVAHDALTIVEGASAVEDISGAPENEAHAGLDGMRSSAARTRHEADTHADSVPDVEEVTSLLEALQKSKQDPLPLNSDGVVVLRLTRMARSPQLRKHLMTTATLTPCRQRVEDAGCSLVPFGEGGPQSFVPLTQEQVAEAEMELSYDNVVILNSDVARFNAALREFNCKGKTRPKGVPAVNFGSVPQDEVAHSTWMQEPMVASSSASFIRKEASVVEEGLVEAEPAGFFNVRTDSSWGFGEYPGV